MLKRYWLRFEGMEPYNQLCRGCGVTAYDYNDALSLLSESVFKEMAMPPVREAIEDVDISTLDQGHVIPNMEAPVWRGVWYPKGYRQQW